MKTSIASFLLFLFFFSCGNPCDDIDCGANGTCNEDSEACICDQFYEGERCENEVRAKFLGTWNGTGLCDYNPNNTFDLTVDISQTVNIDGIALQSTQILQEFSITGELDEDDNIFFPEFMAHIGSNTHDGNLLHIDASNIELTLNAYVNGVKNTCVYTLKK